MNTQDLAKLFDRDLRRLHQQIAAFPGDDLLWQTLQGITNSAGNLALHLEGNLREYVGRILGGLLYIRARDLEFSSRSVSQSDLLARIAALQGTIPGILERLSQDQLKTEFPLVVLGRPVSTEMFLIHIYGHFNLHLGQIEYLRRALTGQGALASAGL